MEINNLDETRVKYWFDTQNVLSSNFPTEFSWPNLGGYRAACLCFGEVLLFIKFLLLNCEGKILSIII